MFGFGETCAALVDLVDCAMFTRFGQYLAPHRRRGRAALGPCSLELGGKDG